MNRSMCVIGKGGDIMKLIDWLIENYHKKMIGEGYDEARAYDKHGNFLWFWHGENDPQYRANVIKVTDVYGDGCMANIYTDWEEKEYA